MKRVIKSVTMTFAPFLIVLMAVAVVSKCCASESADVTVFYSVGPICVVSVADPGASAKGDNTFAVKLLVDDEGEVETSSNHLNWTCNTGAWEILVNSKVEPKNRVEIRAVPGGLGTSKITSYYQIVVDSTPRKIASSPARQAGGCLLEYCVDPLGNPLTEGSAIQEEVVELVYTIVSID